MRENYTYMDENDDLMISEPLAPFSVKRPPSSIISFFMPTLFNLDELPPKISKTTNEFGEKIIKVDGEIPIDLEVKTGDRFLFISYDQSVLTHGLHKYRFEIHCLRIEN